MHLAALSELLANCDQATQWLETAAEGVENQQLQLLFRSYANQHARYRDELRNMMGSLCGSSWIAAANANRMIPLSRTSMGDAGLLERCRETEKALRNTYEIALRGRVPDELELALRAQYHGVRKIEKYLGALDSRQ